MARLADMLAAPARPVVGVDLYRPSTQAGEHRFVRTLDVLRDLDLTYASISCGTQGFAEGGVRDVVVALNSQESYPVLAHLTRGDHTRAELDELLDDYERHGVGDVLALDGGPPPGAAPRRSDLASAVEIVEAVRERGDRFSVGVAAHPELHPSSTNRANDRSRLADQLRVADFAVTQFFFDATHYFSMMDDLSRLGVSAPVVPGVLPLWDPSRVRRLAARAGVSFPTDVAARIEQADWIDRPKIVVEAAAELCRRLLDQGAPGLHLFSLNSADVVKPLIVELGLR